MPFTRGTPKPPNSGRKKGNGNKQFRGTVDEILASVGCSPIEGLAKIAMDEKVDAGVRTRAYAELAQYQHPKRRSIELSGPEGGPIEHDVNPTELFESRIAQLATRVNPESGDPEHDGGAT